MACPTCDHTMACIGSNDRADNYFLCPRCGTVKIDAFGQHGDVVHVPKLIERCRVFEADVVANDPDLTTQTYMRDKWHRLGIRESINVPRDRP